MKTRCIWCDKELSGGLDTYDHHGETYCWNCYAEHNKHSNFEQWYGLGPHEHEYDAQGNIVIGGTVFKSLKDVPRTEDGSYDLGDATFTPDPEAFDFEDESGLGIWERKPLPGWR